MDGNVFSCFFFPVIERVKCLEVVSGCFGWFCDCFIKFFLFGQS